MALSRWLQASRCAVSAADEPLLLELARDILTDVAEDPENPRAFECAAACELAIASYHALAGDWCLTAALARVRANDPDAAVVKRTETARARLDAKAAWTQVMGDVVMRVRAVRNLAAHGKARKATNVLPYQRKTG